MNVSKLLENHRGSMGTDTRISHLKHHAVGRQHTKRISMLPLPQGFACCTRMWLVVRTEDGLTAASEIRTKNFPVDPIVGGGIIR